MKRRKLAREKTQPRSNSLLTPREDGFKQVKKQAANEVLESSYEVGLNALGKNMRIQKGSQQKGWKCNV